mmetsp:Transcript_18943/g.21224  ORF Transcript_18943/g.21224 Transcript_18943/m.21224 type:complete len:123 (+) Transcript_18943:779-1147(+)
MCLIHFLLCFLSNLKFRSTKDPKEYGGADDEVEKIVKKYKKSNERHKELVGGTVSSRSSFMPVTTESEYRFMTEIIYSYFDHDIKRKRREWGSENSQVIPEEESVSEDSISKKGNDKVHKDK